MRQEDGPEVGQVDVVRAAYTRAAYTTVGDVLVAAGFGMLLAAMYALSGKFGLVRGIRLGPRWLCHLSFRARPGGSTVVAGPRRRSIALAAKRMDSRSDIDRPRTCDFRLWTARRKARRRRASLLARRAVPLPVPASGRASTLGSSLRARASFHRAHARRQSDPLAGSRCHIGAISDGCLSIQPCLTTGRNGRWRTATDGSPTFVCYERREPSAEVGCRTARSPNVFTI